MGHALDNMMQDAIIRTKRMQGYSTLWMPGTDHASIATEVKIVDALRDEGTSKEELGRDKFLERAWQWREEFGGRITRQLKSLARPRLGTRAFYDGRGDAAVVREVLYACMKKGLIYQETALSTGARNA